MSANYRSLSWKMQFNRRNTEWVELANVSNHSRAAEGPKRERVKVFTEVIHPIALRRDENFKGILDKFT